MKISKVLFFSTTVLACCYYSCLDALKYDELSNQFKSRAINKQSYFSLSNDIVQVRSAKSDGKQLVNVTELFSGVFQLAKEGYFDSDGFSRYLDWRIKEVEGKDHSFKLEIDQWRTLFFLYMLSKIDKLSYDFFEKTDNKKTPYLLSYFQNMIGYINKSFRVSDESFRVDEPNASDVKDICYNVYNLLSQKGLDLREKNMLAKLKSNTHEEKELNEHCKELNESYIEKVKKLSEDIYEENIFNKFLKEFDAIGKYIEDLEKAKSLEYDAKTSGVVTSIDVKDGRKLVITCNRKPNSLNSNKDSRSVKFSCLDKNQQRVKNFSVSNLKEILNEYSKEETSEERPSEEKPSEEKPSEEKTSKEEPLLENVKSLVTANSGLVNANSDNQSDGSVTIRVADETYSTICLDALRHNIISALDRYIEGIKKIRSYIKQENDVQDPDTEDALSDMLKEVLLPYESIKSSINDVIKGIESVKGEINKAIDDRKTNGGSADDVSKTIKKCKGIVGFIIDRITTNRDEIMDCLSLSVGPKISLLRLLSEDKSITLDAYRDLADCSVDEIFSRYSRHINKSLKAEVFDRNNKINRIIAAFKVAYYTKYWPVDIDISFRDFVASSLLDIFPDFKKAVNSKKEDKNLSKPFDLFYLPIDLDSKLVEGVGASQNYVYNYIKNNLKYCKNGTMSNQQDLLEDYPLFLCYDTKNELFYLLEKSGSVCHSSSSYYVTGREKLYGGVVNVHAINNIIRTNDTKLKEKLIHADVDKIGKNIVETARTYAQMLQYVLFGTFDSEEFNPVPYTLEQGEYCLSNEKSVLSVKDSYFSRVPVSYMSYNRFDENTNLWEGLAANAIVFKVNNLHNKKETTEIRRSNGKGLYRPLESRLDSQYKDDFANLIVKISSTLSEYIGEDKIKDNVFEFFVTKLIAFASAMKYIALSPKEGQTGTVFAQADLLADRITQFLKYNVKKIKSNISASELENIIEVLGDGGIAFDSKALRPQGFCVNEHTIVAIYKALVYGIRTAPISSGVELSDEYRCKNFDRFPLRIGSFQDVVNSINKGDKEKRLKKEIEGFGDCVREALDRYSKALDRYDGTKLASLKGVDSSSVSGCRDIIIKLKEMGCFQNVDLDFNKGSFKLDDIKSIKNMCDKTSGILKSIKEKIQGVLEKCLEDFNSDDLGKKKDQDVLAKIYKAVTSNTNPASAVTALKNCNTYGVNIPYFISNYKPYRLAIYRHIESLISIKNEYEWMQSELYYDIDGYFRLVNKILSSALLAKRVYKYDVYSGCSREDEMALINALVVMCSNSDNTLNESKLNCIENEGKELLRLCYEYNMMYYFHQMLQTQYDSNPDSDKHDAGKVLNVAEYIEGVGKYINKSARAQEDLKRCVENGDIISGLTSEDLTERSKYIDDSVSNFLREDVEKMASVCLKYMGIDEEKFISGVRQEMGQSSLLSCVFGDSILKKIHNLIDTFVVVNCLTSESGGINLLSKFKGATHEKDCNDALRQGYRRYRDGDLEQAKERDREENLSRLRIYTYAHVLQNESVAELKNIISNAYYMLLEDLSSFKNYADSMIEDIWDSGKAIYNKKVDEACKEIKNLEVYEKNAKAVSLDGAECKIELSNIKLVISGEIDFVKVVGDENIGYSVLSDRYGTKYLVVCELSNSGIDKNINAYNFDDVWEKTKSGELYNIKFANKNLFVKINDGKLTISNSNSSEESGNSATKYLYIDGKGEIGAVTGTRASEKPALSSDAIAQCCKIERGVLLATDKSSGEIKWKDDFKKEEVDFSNIDENVKTLAKTAIFKDKLIKYIIKIQDECIKSMSFDPERCESLKGFQVFKELSPDSQNNIISKIKDAFVGIFDSTIFNDIMQEKDIASKYNDKNQNLSENLSSVFNIDAENLDISNARDLIAKEYFPFISRYERRDISDKVYRSIIKNKIDVLKKSPYLYVLDGVYQELKK